MDMSKSLLKVVPLLLVVFMIACNSDSKSERKEEAKITKKAVSKKSDSPKKIKKEIPVSSTSAALLSRKVEINKIDYSLLSDRLMQKMNSERKRLSLKPFVSNRKLTKASKMHNDYMVRENILDHKEIGTSTPNMMDRVEASGGRFRTVGENVQYEGFVVRKMNGVEHSILAPTYEELADNLWKNWKNSPSHYKNIINPDFTMHGLSLKWSNEKKAVFATQLYAGR